MTFHSSLTCFVVLCFAAASGCGGASRPSRSSGRADEVGSSIEINLLEDGAIEVSGFDGPTVRQLESGEVDEETWANLLVVRAGKDETLPPVIGKHSYTEGRVRFVPTYPLQPGVRFEVIWQGEALQISRGVTARETVRIPAPKLEPTTQVIRVDPPGETLPENLLRLYVHFSAPMSRGRSYERVHLFDSNGDEVEAAFLELGEELWDAEGRRFTLFFDPGRIKRELVPRRELGPALEDGGEFTLVIDADWHDGRDAPLVKEFRRTFRIGPPDTTRPTPNSWKLVAPAVGGRSPLAITFDERLDRPMLERFLTVESGDGTPVAGRFEVSEDTLSVRFEPAAPWSASPHALVVDTRLEDVAGNSVGRPFEVEIADPVAPTDESSAFVRVPFEITK